MTIEIGDIIKGYLQSLSFIDKLAGVVKVLNKVDVDQNGKTITKRFPVACNVDFSTCNTSDKYKDLIPDSSLGCIVFLEDLGVRFIGNKGNKQGWKASYRLVGWVNNSKLGTDNCSVTGQIIASVINKFPIVPFNNGIYQSVVINVIGQDPKTGNDPFSKYSFDESKTQYLMYPFDYFSLIIDVNFDIDKRCLTDFIKSTPINCV